MLQKLLKIRISVYINNCYVKTTQYKIVVSFQEQNPMTLFTGYCTNCATYGDNVLYYTYK